MTEQIKNKIQNRQTVVWLLIVLAGLLSLSYLYFVGRTVYSVTERQKNELLVDSLENNIEKLQTDYTALKAKVTTELALEKGFQSISSSKFISRKPLGKVLSINNEI